MLRTKKVKTKLHATTPFTILPYHVIVDIIEFHIFILDLDSLAGCKESDKFLCCGYFKLDRFRKIFQIFNSLLVTSLRSNGKYMILNHQETNVKFNILFYFDASRIIFLHNTVKCGFIPLESNLNWRNLEYLGGGLSTAKGILNQKKDSDFESIECLRFESDMDYHDNFYLSVPKINVYPQDLGISFRCFGGQMSGFNNSYFNNQGIRNLKKLRMYNIGYLNPENWIYEFEKLEGLELRDCNFVDELFQNREFKKLKSLSIIYNQQDEFSSDGGKNWIGVPNLRSFKFIGHAFSPDTITKFTKLKILFMSVLDTDSWRFRLDGLEELLLLSPVKHIEGIKLPLAAQSHCLRKLSLYDCNFDCLVEYRFVKNLRLDGYEPKSIKCIKELFGKFRFPNLEILFLDINSEPRNLESRHILDARNFEKVRIFRTKRINGSVGLKLVETYRFPELVELDIYTVRWDEYDFEETFLRSNLPKLKLLRILLKFERKKNNLLENSKELQLKLEFPGILIVKSRGGENVHGQFALRSKLYKKLSPPFDKWVNFRFRSASYLSELERQRYDKLGYEEKI